MNWATMSQKQKQIVIGSGLGAVAILYLVFQFGWKPYAERRDADAAELAELKAKIEKAVQAGKNEQALMEDLRASRTAMTRVARELVPSPDNALSWVTRAIYAQARKVGVDIESVSETGDGNMEFTSKEQAARAFKPYGVVIALRCSYAKLVGLVEALESTNPNLLIASISVSASESKEQHSVNLIVQWPLWKDAAKGRGFEEEISAPEPELPPAEPQPEANQDA